MKRILFIGLLLSLLGCNWKIDPEDYDVVRFRINSSVEKEYAQINLYVIDQTTGKDSVVKYLIDGDKDIITQKGSWAIIPSSTSFEQKDVFPIKKGKLTMQIVEKDGRKRHEFIWPITGNTTPIDFKIDILKDSLKVELVR